MNENSCFLLMQRNILCSLTIIFLTVLKCKNRVLFQKSILFLLLIWIQPLFYSGLEWPHWSVSLSMALTMMAGAELPLCAPEEHVCREQTANGAPPLPELQLRLGHRYGTVSAVSRKKGLFWRITAAFSQDGARSPFGWTVSEILLLPSALSF